VLIGGVGVCAGYFLTSLADSLFVCYITHGFIAGLFSCFAWQPCVVIIPQYFVKKRSTSTGIAVAGSGVGTFAMAPLTSFLFNELGAVKRLLCVSFSVQTQAFAKTGSGQGPEKFRQTVLPQAGEAACACWVSWRWAPPSSPHWLSNRSETGSVEPFMYKNDLVTQDRLRTNIGENQGKLTFSSQGPLYTKRPRPSGCLGLDMGLWKNPLFRGEKNVLFEPLIYIYNDLFTKTGSGQT
jgi:hypothetical protein